MPAGPFLAGRAGHRSVGEVRAQVEITPGHLALGIVTASREADPREPPRRDRRAGPHSARQTAGMTLPERAVLFLLSRLLGALPVGVGQHAVARRLEPRFRRANGAIVQTSLSGGGCFELNLSDRNQLHTYLTRRYEPEVVATIAASVRPGGCFIDVGANIGLITFSVGARRRDIQIVAFEPDPTNVDAFRRNQVLNTEVRVVLEHSALGSTIGEVEVVSGDESGWSHVRAPSQTAGCTVAMTTLDSYAQQLQLETVDVLKIDVEGYELQVLSGSDDLLSGRRIGAIVCEVNDLNLQRNGSSRDELISQLAGHEYDPSPLPPVGAHRLRRSTTIESAPELLFTPRRGPAELLAKTS